MFLLALLIAWLGRPKRINPCEVVPVDATPPANPAADLFVIYHVKKWLQKYRSEFLFLPQNELVTIGGLSFYASDKILTINKNGHSVSGDFANLKSLLSELFIQLDCIDFY